MPSLDLCGRFTREVSRSRQACEQLGPPFGGRRLGAPRAGGGGARKSGARRLRAPGGAAAHGAVPHGRAGGGGAAAAARRAQGNENEKGRSAVPLVQGMLGLQLFAN